MQFNNWLTAYTSPSPCKLSFYSAYAAVATHTSANATNYIRLPAVPDSGTVDLIFCPNVPRFGDTRPAGMPHSPIYPDFWFWCVILMKTTATHLMRNIYTCNLLQRSSCNMHVWKLYDSCHSSICLLSLNNLVRPYVLINHSPLVIWISFHRSPFCVCTLCRLASTCALQSTVLTIRSLYR